MFPVGLEGWLTFLGGWDTYGVTTIDLGGLVIVFGPLLFHSELCRSGVIWEASTGPG